MDLDAIEVLSAPSGPPSATTMIVKPNQHRGAFLKEKAKEEAKEEKKKRTKRKQTRKRRS